MTYKGVPEGKTAMSVFLDNDLLHLLDLIKIKFRLNSRKEAANKAIRLLSEMEPFKKEVDLIKKQWDVGE